MNPLLHTGKNRQRRPAGVAAKVFVAILLAFGLTGSAVAMDQPPDTAPQQRAWLTSHLVTDMQSVGSFSSTDISQMVTLVNSLTDDQVVLLTRFYFLTREKTEQDAQLYAVQQTETADALAQAKAQVADLLTQLHNQIQQTYSELATINPGCETLCQVAYASVPGWCAYNQYAIPDWYYNNGCYVGPVFSGGYCGAYAVPVYQTFYNRGSHYNYWNSRTYIHNNMVRIGHHGSPVVTGIRHPHPVNHTGAATVNHNAPPVLKHNNPNPRANHAPNAVARHNAPKLHDPAAVAKNHAHASGAKKANHSQPHAVAHNNPKAHAQAHAAPRPHQQHVAHAQPHGQPRQAARAPKPHVAHAQPHAQHAAHPQPQHVAQAHPSSGHGRHK